MGENDQEKAMLSNTHFVALRILNKDFIGDDLLLNDVAILILKKNVTLGNKVQLACLPTPLDSDKILNRNTVLTGWGAIDGIRTNLAANLLQQTVLRVRNGNNGVCNLNFYNPNFHYCAISDNRLENACLGDSGGPLMYHENSKWYVYGIVSYVITRGSIGCIVSEPSFYTKVPVYLSWLESVIPFGSPNSSVKEKQSIYIIFIMVLLACSLRFFN